MHSGIFQLALCDDLEVMCQIRGKCCIPFSIIPTIALLMVENALFFVEQEQDGSVVVMHQIPSPIHLHGG